MAQTAQRISSVEELDTLLARKKELMDKDLADALAKAKPLRDRIDALLDQKNKIDEELAPLLEQWRPLNEQHQSLQNEIARVSRNLKGHSTSQAPRG